MSDSSEDSEILIFVLICLLIGGLARELNKLTKIPYTPLLLVVGIAWGSLESSLGMLGDSASRVSDIDPHMILLVFLPALVYESSSGTDWHIFKRELGQVMLLAFPGVLISAFLTAFTILYICDYSSTFSFVDALVLGSILAATDPVAVVALLKEVGASKNLATLIEGESLLNDGTAVVLFTVVLDMAKGVDIGAIDVIYSFIRMTIGGPLLGLLFGIAMAFWVRRVFNDSILEILITFFSVYLLFYVAEGTELHVSGILALVALGMFMSAWGKTTIDVYSESIVHNFWKMMGFIGETLIFLLSGTIIGSKVIAENNIEWEDWLKLLLLFVMVTVIRALSVALFYPIFSRYAYGFSWKQAVILVYGGLRGAVGLALALIVNRETDEDISDEVRNLTLFHTAGIATLTMLINATTTGYLISMLGLTKISKTQENLYKQVVQSLHEQTAGTIQELKLNKFLHFADWEHVKEFADVVTLEKSEGEARMNEIVVEGMDSSEIEYQLRHRFLCILKGLYWEEYETGQCSARSMLILTESADRCLDHEKTPMADWKYLESTQLGMFFKILNRCKNVVCIKKFLTKTMYHSFVRIYDISCSFMAAHLEAESKIREILSANPPDELSLIIAESTEQVQRCNDFVSNNMTDVFCEIFRDIQTKKALYQVLHKQKKALDEFHNHGFIDAKEFVHLSSLVLYKMHQLNKRGLKSKMPRLGELLRKIEFFEQFDREDLNYIIDNAEKKLFKRGDFLFHSGEETKGVFILLRGKVTEYNEHFSYDHIPGSIIGIQHLLNNLSTNVTSSKAKTAVYTAYVDREMFPDYESSHKIEESLWKHVTPLIIKLNPEAFISILASIDYDRLKRLVKYCDFVKVPSGDKVDLSSGGILVSGILNKLNNSSVQEFPNKLKAKTLKMTKINAFHFIEPDDKHSYFVISDNVVILILCEEILEAFFNRKKSLRGALDRMAYRKQSTYHIRAMDSFSQAAFLMTPQLEHRFSEYHNQQRIIDREELDQFLMSTRRDPDLLDEDDEDLEEERKDDDAQVNSDYSHDEDSD